MRLLTTAELCSRRVCIIGAGATGLGISGMLWRHGISNVVIDRHARIGGIWNDQAAAYAGLKLHSPSYYYQFLDDELDCDDNLEHLLANRRSVAEQLEYFEEYAGRHHLLFLGNVSAQCPTSTQVQLTRQADGVTARLRFEWVIDCTVTRPNAGQMRRLENARPLSDAMFGKPRGTRFAVVGGSKSGTDAVVQLHRRGFTNVVWICSRKLGFLLRESYQDRDGLLAAMDVNARSYFANRRWSIHGALVTPHDTIDCFKYGIIDSAELGILRNVRKVYGTVRRIESAAGDHQSNGQEVLCLHLGNGHQEIADVAVSALGPDPAPVIDRRFLLLERYGSTDTLLLNMFDCSKRLVFVVNDHVETATGASLLGLLIAFVLTGRVTPQDLAALNRVKLPGPEVLGCGLGLKRLPPSDASVMESSILALLGLPGRHSFRLLDKDTRRAIMNLPVPARRPVSASPPPLPASGAATSSP